MKIRKILILLIAGFSTQLVVAADAPAGTPSPLGDLQAQIDALAARTAALENAAPNSSVEGRDYCSELDLLVMRGFSGTGTEELQTNLVRRVVTFSGGTMIASLLSNTLNNQQDDGVVIHKAGTPIDPLIATYTQTGNKVDLTFINGPTATWYVSKDGSMLHGSKISFDEFGPGGVVKIGFLRNWTLVEAADPAACDAEGQ